MTDWDDIREAIGLALGGEKAEGKKRLERCWEQSLETDHPKRCVLAHYLADLQANLDDEVDWDERALAAYPYLADGDLAVVGIPHARDLAPSLHLNLGDGYLRQGRVEGARAQLEAGRAQQDALREDGYGALIRKGLAGLDERIRATRPSAPA